MNAGPVIGTMLQLTPMSLKPFPSPRFYNEMYLSSKKIEDIPKSQKEFLPSALFINNYQPPNLGVTQKFSKSKQGHLWAHTGIGRAGASVKVKGGNQSRLSLCKCAPPPPNRARGSGLSSARSTSPPLAAPSSGHSAPQKAENSATGERPVTTHISPRLPTRFSHHPPMPSLLAFESWGPRRARSCQEPGLTAFGAAGF